ncbi:adenylate/guanylate cyclase domain-containing protein [Rhabdaerophilum sp. SD176]|uniref:adenylate/guanylate cyclase domain-containing protein n=1 Tax=Rhabdaerophilum sp. SD176 TaxID=2983548 RepID=UPI0024E01FB6|nr:adenylate/guanylate cyclase domain-containing protein [Rhabdaerophilum sp. SD176]
MKRFQLGFGLAIFLAIAASVMLCGVLVHVTWSRTAGIVSRDLLGALEQQIAEAARKAWWDRVEATEAAARLVGVALDAEPAPAVQENLILAAMRGNKVAGSLLLVRKDGTSAIFSHHPDGAVSILERDQRDVPIGHIRIAPGGQRSDMAEPVGSAEPRMATESPWLRLARAKAEPGWLSVPSDGPPAGNAVAYVRNVPQGVLAFLLTFERFAGLLADIPVSRTGRLAVLAPDGDLLVRSQSGGTPDGSHSEVERALGQIVAARAAEAKDVTEHRRLVLGSGAYAVSLSPLHFRNWQLAVIVPEADFLGEITQMLSRVTLGLFAFVLVIGVVASLATRFAIARPMERVVEDLALVETFALEAVPRRRSPLREIDRLSAAIVRMSHGLADFAKFIPTELVRNLIREGMRAEPGGTQREITVLFADLAGFTRLTEVLGDDAVPIVSAFLELASKEVAATGGTVDKFIGDAIMAFWGAPASNPDHARDACDAALRIMRQFDALRKADARFAPLSVRIGLQSGNAIVGNVGSSVRLNYTALGDVVNLASRLEGINKMYGTTILIGQETADRIEGTFALREVDSVRVYGRQGDVTLVELCDAHAPWMDIYGQALDAYRRADFDRALEHLSELERTCPTDGPGQRLRAICNRLQANGVPADWQPITMLEGK